MKCKVIDCSNDSDEEGYCDGCYKGIKLARSYNKKKDKEEKRRKN